MTTLCLVLGDQLNPEHRWFQQVNPDTLFVLMEVRAETTYVLHHAQKVLGIFAALRDFARHLREAGHRVRHIAIDDPHNRHSIAANLEALADAHQAREVRYQSPDEHRLDTQLADLARRLAQRGVAVHMDDTEHFLSGRHDAQSLFGDSRHWLMERFYRHMRRTHGVLMQNDATGRSAQPEGGQWNYDHDNRKPWHGSPPAPADWRRAHDHRTLWRDIEAAGVQTFGEPQAEAFRWPLNRREALADLNAFVDHALPHFGDHQDALSGREWRLFHSLLSFALNVKMLHPREVIDAAVSAWRQGQAPLAGVEGFVRQILGWREYVRGVYWAHMPGYTEGNALGHHLPLPAWFWHGDTRMACMRQAVGQSLTHAYAHHIQRLMVIGNFALLAGLDPQALHRWYLGVYIDAFEWVEAPNTLGMSQCADGGTIATKPYVSSAAYIDRMGDHCKGCHYKKKERLGQRACPFNALYWDFHLRHEARYRSNPRIGMVYRQLERMTDEERTAIRQQAVHWQASLEQL